MRVLVDRNHHKILLKDINLPGPPFNSIMASDNPFLPCFNRRRFTGKTTEPERGKYVNPDQLILLLENSLDLNWDSYKPVCVISISIVGTYRLRIYNKLFHIFILFIPPPIKAPFNP